MVELSHPWRRMLFTLLAVLLSSGLASAQTSTAAPDPQTPAKPAEARWVSEAAEKEAIRKRTAPPPSTVPRSEQLKAWGLTEDPGLDPDPKTVWVRFGTQYTIEKFEKRFARFDQQEGWVRPLYTTNFAREIYHEDDKFVWVWMDVPKPVQREPAPFLGDPDKTPRTKRYYPYTAEQIGFIQAIKPDFEPLTPPPSGEILSFEETFAARGGSWRNSPALADMNEDGFVDIVTPPQRSGGDSRPYIFLGDGKGSWTFWETPRWPANLAYGSVAAGDLNKDGHQDLVFGVHLHGVVAFLGDGKGTFADVSETLPKDFATRRAVVRDMDGDGDLDIVAISEGPSLYARNSTMGNRLKVFLNENKARRWKEVKVEERGRGVAGDWLGTGNFNGDSLPDIVGSSIIFNAPDLFYMSSGKEKYKAFGRGWLPFHSYYGALTVGKFTSKKKDDVILGFGRAWPQNVDPAVVSHPPIQKVAGIERISFAGKEPKRSSIARWKSESAIWGMASADFNADGHLDVIYWQPDPREFVVLFGDSRGGFKRASLSGMNAPPNTLYDITVGDVNGDRRPDVVVLYESEENQGNGSVRVYLNRGTTRALAMK